MASAYMTVERLVISQTSRMHTVGASQPDSANMFGSCGTPGPVMLLISSATPANSLRQSAANQPAGCGCTRRAEARPIFFRCGSACTTPVMPCSPELARLRATAALAPEYGDLPKTPKGAADAEPGPRTGVASRRGGIAPGGISRA